MRYLIILAVFLTACASTKNTPVSNDAGTPVTQGECLSLCRTNHPVGAVKADAIDACWAKSCNPACTVGDPNGKTYKPDAVGTACKSDLLTPTVACSNCTQANCCDAWDGCFGNDDCVALNDCSLNCWTLPPDPK